MFFMTALAVYVNESWVGGEDIIGIMFLIGGEGWMGMWLTWGILICKAV